MRFHFVVLLSFVLSTGAFAGLDGTASGLLPYFRILYEMKADGASTSAIKEGDRVGVGFALGLVSGVSLVTQEMQRGGALSKDLDIDLGTSGVRSMIVYKYLIDHPERLTEKDNMVVLMAFLDAIKKKNGL